MLPMSLAQIAHLLDGQIHGRGDVQITSVALDSREVEPGSLFVGLIGERVDGHEFAADAAARGALGMLGQRPDPALPSVVVADPVAALAKLGKACRHQSNALVLALTGSNGKTTVKELVAAMLANAAPTLATMGNRNNHLGVPQTLTRLRPEHRFAVIEMGANHPGEIAGLAELAEPHIGLVTNAAEAHLEGFGSLDGVAHAKGELFDSLGGDSSAIINIDDRYARLWQEKSAAAGRTISFGRSAAADVRWRNQGEELEIYLDGRWQSTPTALLGEHNSANACAAAACAHTMGVPAEQIRAALAQVRAPRGRLQPLPGLRCRMVIDDSYNANPASLEAALAVLEQIVGEKWLLLGEMAELGADSPAWHRRAGELARAAGVARLWTLGRRAALAAESFGAGGRDFADLDSLLVACREELPAQGVVLIKGSRTAGMERLVAALSENTNTTAQGGQ
ncbi:UDP-N-acetylmuramoyl-tripeptide--D-alanyl-D-alanine ligase [Halorhodospira halochloris]|uniref:UDP-N-acetylmuramoyl-tripeptide--D-alanyl-D- alanine ligase n=1 Tax=Halorhodospira halochloris TaxID=1052 RepID=UPI001EE8A337|nr:UDP-N-acetylmuramoyl-tripeptide--D-alanyl-D-alanine ligase [Halorhodospira halochloris]MCG5529574.1 UDP-N-acetylmuramoyl-tripeptide--D-alanyl-D-alanine ligase [Halorhodospira halochloris]